MTASESNHFSRLPIELISSISFYLTNRDIKNLRLTCRFLLRTSRLRLNRVFLSANPLNIRVFRAVADHEIYRLGITEIIWDDARLAKSYERGEMHPAEYYYPEYEDPDDLDEGKGCPKWFAKACRENVEELVSRKGEDVDRPDHLARAEQVAAQLPLKQCWQHYQNLLQQQEDVLVFGSDVDALLYGLKRFPALRRMTITPGAHGWIFAPLYETPMIRALPKGFNYPIPRSWPTTRDGKTEPEIGRWEDSDEAEKNKWRGFRVVTCVLAQHEEDHHITELVIDLNGLKTGLHCRIFDEPCEEYDNLVRILRRPRFSHLHLDFMVQQQEHEDWPSFRSGYLRRALAQAPDLQHFRLRTNVEPDPDSEAMLEGSGGSISHFIPLRTLFPVEKWLRLRHFQLSGFLVTQADVVSLLSALPSTLRSVELSFLEFLDHGGHWYGLLMDIRDNLGWRQRDEKPKVIVGLAPWPPRTGFGIWIEKETNEFLYGDGPNPFMEDLPRDTLLGIGTIRDTFEAEHERPNSDPWDLARMGYIKKDPLCGDYE